MFEISVDIFFLSYLVCGLSLILSLWFYYDWRQAHQYEAKRFKVIYHCLKCSCIYTESNQSEESDCPRCGFTNGRLHF